MNLCSEKIIVGNKVLYTGNEKVIEHKDLIFIDNCIHYFFYSKESYLRALRIRRLKLKENMKLKLAKEFKLKLNWSSSNNSKKRKSSNNHDYPMTSSFKLTDIIDVIDDDYDVNDCNDILLKSNNSDKSFLESNTK